MTCACASTRGSQTHNLVPLGPRLYTHIYVYTGHRNGAVLHAARAARTHMRHATACECSSSAGALKKNQVNRKSAPSLRRTYRNRRTRGGELGSGIGTTLVKDPHTRTLALASGHGRCMTVTPERTLISVGEWPLHTVQPSHVYSRFASETESSYATRRFRSETPGSRILNHRRGF